MFHQQLNISMNKSFLLTINILRERTVQSWSTKLNL